MREPAVPTYDVAEGCDRFSFPDATHLEILRPQRDAMGHLRAQVLAKHGDDRVFNGASLDLLDLRACLRFHPPRQASMGRPIGGPGCCLPWSMYCRLSRRLR